jgi:hypothetical protein
MSDGYEAEYNLEFFETRLMRLDSVRISSEPIDTQHRANYYARGNNQNFRNVQLGWSDVL